MADYRYIQDKRTSVKHRILGVVDNTLTEEGIAADAKVVGDALATKAEVDGSYDSMTVGNAEQLISSVYEEDSVPYTFRTSGGSIDIGDREEDKIIGGTMAWNQLFPFDEDVFSANGVTWTIENGKVTVSGKSVITSGGFSIFPSSIYNNLKLAQGHKYYLHFNGDTNTGISYTMYYTGHAAQSVRLTDNKTSQIFTPNYDDMTDSEYVIGLTAGTDATGEFYTYLCDLTQMFGSTIADYIYTLEQTTAGAGVAWFRKLFPKDYYAYNPGELLSVSDLQSHDMVGFNAWDGETESGYVYNGTYYSSNDYWRTKNFIPVVGGASYYFKVATGGQIACYDAEKTYITSIADFGGSSHIATMPSNCAYIKFYQGVAADKNTVCVNLSWDGERDGEYEPYKKWSYPLDDSLTLRGIPKLDADNKLYYDGDVYESDGTVTRKYQKILIDGGTNGRAFSAGFGATNNGYAVYINTGLGNRTANAISDKFVVNTNPYASMPLYSFVGGSGSHTAWTFILPSTVTNITEANAWAKNNPFNIIIPLETPTTESADPYQNPQIVDDFGTEEYVTTSIVPVGHETKYQPNLRAKLEMAPNSPDGNGDYIVRHTNGENAYVPLAFPADELPPPPTEDGTYSMTVVVSNGTPTYAWASV